MKNFFLIAVTIACITYVSCSSSGQTNSVSNSSFDNTRWVLRVLNGMKVYTPEGGNEAFMNFVKDKSSIRGNGGCNNFFGTYVKEGKTLKIGPVARTEMYCENTMKTEDGFMKALESARTYKIKGVNLYLYDSLNNNTAKFEAVYLN